MRSRSAALHASENTVRDTPINEIKANKYQASLGLRSRRGNLLYGFAVTENVAHYQNTPDIGLSITLAWIAPNKTDYKPAQRAGRTSPGPRPKADALGKRAAIDFSGLKGRENHCRDQLDFYSAEVLAALQAALIELRLKQHQESIPRFVPCESPPHPELA